MTARVLVVDDMPVNVRLLAAKLSAEYYEVLTAESGAEALRCVQAESPDVVLLDVMMPEMDGFEVCRSLKADPATAHIPIIMVTALSETADRVRGLEAGADDFLTKPVDDLALFARLRSVLRLKMLFDELRLREETSRQIGSIAQADVGQGLQLAGRALIVDDDRCDAELITGILEPTDLVETVSSCEEALQKVASQEYELVFINLALSDSDPLRLCSHLRSNEKTRHSSIVITVDDGDSERLAKALDIGVNDYLPRPIDRSELCARIRTQLRYRSYKERIREAYEESVSMALTDSLTGLYNRRYVSLHLTKLGRRQSREGGDVAVLMVDIDHFKTVNDTHGHHVGDEVLREVGKRLNDLVRDEDLAARLGGEEFVIVMSNADTGQAQLVAERLRRVISDEPITVPTDEGSLTITVSVGVALRMQNGETPDEQLQRADGALYDAKRSGRDCVVMAA